MLPEMQTRAGLCDLIDVKALDSSVTRSVAPDRDKVAD